MLNCVIMMGYNLLNYVIVMGYMMLYCDIGGGGIFYFTQKKKSSHLLPDVRNCPRQNCHCHKRTVQVGGVFITFLLHLVTFQF